MQQEKLLFYSDNMQMYCRTLSTEYKTRRPMQILASACSPIFLAVARPQESIADSPSISTVNGAFVSLNIVLFILFFSYSLYNDLLFVNAFRTLYILSLSSLILHPIPSISTTCCSSLSILSFNVSMHGCQVFNCITGSKLIQQFSPYSLHIFAQLYTG